MGVGVAGLQAIATAKRLGAKVRAYDVRSAAKEEAESAGAVFVQLGVTADAAGGYARELTDEETRSCKRPCFSEVANPTSSSRRPRCRGASRRSS
jgi:NAD(P) transhydrogenase subunit alpha